MRRRCATVTFAVAALSILVGSASADPQGPALDWETRHSVSPGPDLATDLAADSHSVFAGGAAFGPAGNFDPYVGAFDAKTGVSRWQLAPVSPAGADFINVVDRAGELLFAAGRLFDSVTRRDAFVEAIDPATGTVLWQDRRDLAGRADEVLALDATGDRVIAAGYGGDCAGPFAGDCDLFVRSYDAVSGELLWQSVAGGGASDFDAVGGVVIAGDRVFAAGVLTESTSGPDFVVRAHALSDGSLLWQDRYDQSQGFDIASPIVHRAGAVFAGGATSSGVPGPPDAVIRAYRAGTGELRWSSTIPGAGW